jgi:tRNA(fMet)-specific endonuclease VapC
MSEQRIRYLIDTDILIDYTLRREPSTHMLSDLLEDGVAISILSYGELLEGILGRQSLQEREDAVTSILEIVTLINLSEEIVRMFAEVRSGLRRTGRLIGDFDILIGATAVIHDLTLLTRNVRHFERIPHLRILSPFHSE